MNLPRLDFLAAPARPAAWSWALLAAGLVLAVWAALDYRAARTQHDTAQASLVRQRPAPVRSPAVDPRAKARAAALQEARARLDAPWNELLATLQTSRPRDIVLQSLEADAARASFRIEAEARRHPAMLDYLRELQGQPALAQVALIRHEALDADGVEVVGFSLGGHWRRP